MISIDDIISFYKSQNINLTIMKSDHAIRFLDNDQVSIVAISYIENNRYLISIDRTFDYNFWKNNFKITNFNKYSSYALGNIILDKDDHLEFRMAFFS